MVTKMKRQKSHHIPKRYTTAYNYAVGEWRQSYVSNHDNKKDKRYKAKAPGWRPVYKNGVLDHYYFERRNNRSDTTAQRKTYAGTTKPKRACKKTGCRKRCRR